MSAVYLRTVVVVEAMLLDYISMENLASVTILSMVALVEMATDLQLWKIVKQGV